MAYCCYVYTARHAKRCIYITTYKWRNNNVIITPNVIATLFWRNGGVIVTWHDVYVGDGTLHRHCTTISYLISREIHNYCIHLLLSYLYNANINICHKRLERAIPLTTCMGRTQLSPCIYNFSTRTIRASRNAMPAWYFFSCWATYIQIFFGKIHNIDTTTVTNSTNVEPVSYIYIIKPTGCQNNPGRVFPLDASASIPVLVALYVLFVFYVQRWRTLRFGAI